MKLKIHLEQQDYLMVLEGELDLSAALLLDQALEEALAIQPHRLLVDCHQLEYISSAGIGVFLSRLQALEQESISLVLFGMSDKIRDVFSLLGLEPLILMVASRSEAYAISPKAAHPK